MSKNYEIDAPRGKSWIRVIDGVVVHLQDETQRSVNTRTTGGGGYVHPVYGGYVSAPTTTTTVTEVKHLRFWLQERDGTKHEFLFSKEDAAFPLAVNHKLRFVTGGNMAKPKDGSYLFVHNHTLDKKRMLKADDLWDWAREQDLIQYPLWYRMMFRWPIFLLFSYAMLIWAPLLEAMPKAMTQMPFTFSNTLKSVLLTLQWLPHWSPSLLVATYAKMDSRFWLGLVFVCLAVLILWGILEFVGYLMIGKWWRFWVLHPFRDRVVNTFAK